ncbi:globin [bacterium]|nr:globin [bacterium]
MQEFVAQPKLFDQLGGRPKLELFLKNFYATVRIDPTIGPIFEGAVDDWPAHIQKIAGFWSLQTGGPPDYRGGLLARHIPLTLKAEHFAAWLTLWEKSCRAHFPEPEAREMIGKAHELGTRMRSALGVRS